MATDLFECVFNQILLKTAKMTILRHFSNSVPLRPPHFKDNWIFFNFPPIFYLSNVDKKNLAGFGSFEPELCFRVNL